MIIKYYIFFHICLCIFYFCDSFIVRYRFKYNININKKSKYLISKYTYVMCYWLIVELFDTMQFDLQPNVSELWNHFYF